MEHGGGSHGARRSQGVSVSPVHKLIAPSRTDDTIVTFLSFESFADTALVDVRELQSCLNESAAVWVDVTGLKNRALISELLTILQVPDSAAQQILTLQDRAMSQVYKADFVVTVHAINNAVTLELDQLSILQVGNIVVSFHNNPLPVIQRIKNDICDQQRSLQAEGRLYFMQRLVEAAIDSYKEPLARYSQTLEELEDVVLNNPQSLTTHEIHKTRKELFLLKRLLLPLLDMMRQTERDLTYYGTDVEKAVARELLKDAIIVLDMIDYHLSLTSELMTLQMTSVSNRMNEVTTVLTIIAAVFLPPTLVSGIYGMNFFEHKSRWSMPELNWDFGYPYALMLMASIDLLFLIYFWRNGWLSVFRARANKNK